MNTKMILITIGFFVVDSAAIQSPQSHFLACPPTFQHRLHHLLDHILFVDDLLNDWKLPSATYIRNGPEFKILDGLI